MLRKTFVQFYLKITLYSIIKKVLYSIITTAPSSLVMLDKIRCLSVGIPHTVNSYK